LIRTEIARAASVSTMLMTRNNENKEVYSFSFSSVQNTKIIILNEETGSSIVITPEDGVSAQFELSPFFIEELRQAVLGDANRYLLVKTGANFSVRKTASVSVASRNVSIPRYFYGSKENMKEALPKNRQIVNIFKEKPKFIPAFPDDSENLRYVAQLEEESSYYVYMYQLPDGTLCIYDEHFNRSAGNNEVNPKGIYTNLHFNLSGNLNTQQQTVTEHAFNLWSEKLGGTVPVDINITYVSLPSGVLGASYFQPHYWNSATQTWYCSTLGNQLAGYDFSPNMRDIRLELSSNFSWNYSISSSPSGSQYDWLTIMLHEITHGLGFSRMINNDGNYYYITNGGSQANTNYPGIYDRQLYQGTSGANLPDLNQSQRAALVVSNNLYAGRPSSYLLNANNGTRVKIYAPSNWVGGSSVSHWDNNVTFTTFMKYSAAPGFRCIVINDKEVAIMLDMGWRTPYYIPSCTTPIINFTNQTVNTNQTITGCYINVQNVIVTNNKKLILDYIEETTINGPFEVQSGSELEVK
jgi:hypothetical protein